MLLPLQLDQDNLPALLMGAVLLTLSALLTIRQWFQYRRLLNSPQVDEKSYLLAERQIRHRLVVAALMFIVGVGIPLGDQLGAVFRVHPIFFFFYWMMILLLVFVMVVVALSDAMSTIVFARATQAELRQQRQELEAEIRRYRESRKQSDADERGQPHRPTDET